MATESGERTGTAIMAVAIGALPASPADKVTGTGAPVLARAKTRTMNTWLCPGTNRRVVHVTRWRAARGSATPQSPDGELPRSDGPRSMTAANVAAAAPVLRTVIWR